MTPAEVDRVVVDVVRDVLGIADESAVTPDSNFFEIGGDSLAAIEVVTRVEERLGTTTSVDAIYDAESLRAFAASLSDAS